MHTMSCHRDQRCCLATVAIPNLSKQLSRQMNSDSLIHPRSSPPQTSSVFLCLLPSSSRYLRRGIFLSFSKNLPQPCSGSHPQSPDLVPSVRKSWEEGWCVESSMKGAFKKCPGGLRGCPRFALTSAI